MSTYVRLSVCLSQRISRKPHDRSQYTSREIARLGRAYLRNGLVGRRTTTRSQLITNFTTSGDTDDAFAAPDDPATNNNGMQFTCKGEDNDLKSSGRCNYHGWWFNDCSRSRLNSQTNGFWDASATVRDVKFDRMLVKFH